MLASMTGYAFGDDRPARDRLELLDAIFRASTEALLARVPPDGVRTVLDLGCGVGCTTASLLRGFPAGTVIGIDTSAAMVEAAAERHGERARFRVGDVTRAPLHDAPVDLVFARLLLAHLPHPGAAIGAWRDQLAPGGRLVLEEIDGLETDDPAFARHLALVERVMGRGGTQLRMGARLGELAQAAAVHDGIARVTPPTADAARLFALNLPRLDPDDAELARDLAARAGGAPARPVTWRVRQLVLAA